MSIERFKQLHDLVINENTEAAKELFHEIVLEKSREIFESMMHDEEDMDEGMGGQVGDLLDEIDAEESGVTEDDEEFDMEFDGEDGDEDFEADFDEPMSDDEGDEVEDAVVRIEDKLDQLIAEFEEIMGGDDDMGDEDMDFGDDDMGDMGDEDMDDEDMDFDDEDMDDEDNEEVMEAVQLQKVSVTHGDNGSNTKNPVAFNSGQAGMDSKPVKFAGASESVPTGPKGPSNAYAKGEGSLPHAGKFKNSPGHKKQDLESAPKPKFGDAGANKKSPVAESRRVKRRPVR